MYHFQVGMNQNILSLALANHIHIVCPSESGIVVAHILSYSSYPG